MYINYFLIRFFIFMKEFLKFIFFGLLILYVYELLIVYEDLNFFLYDV